MKSAREMASTGQDALSTGLEITYRGTVYPSHCDHMGHMNVMWYAGRFDEASWQILSMLGLTSLRLREEGIGMAAVEQHIDYKRELMPGDLITVRSAVLEVKEKSIRLMHEMRNDVTGEVAACTVIVAVHLDRNTRRALRLPDDVREVAAKMMNRSGMFVPLDRDA
jgi:acyl-CoA thioester hydrolase